MSRTSKPQNTRTLQRVDYKSRYTESTDRGCISASAALHERPAPRQQNPKAQRCQQTSITGTLAAESEVSTLIVRNTATQQDNEPQHITRFQPCSRSSKFLCLNDFQARISSHFLHRPSLLYFWPTINPLPTYYFV